MASEVPPQNFPSLCQDTAGTSGTRLGQKIVEGLPRGWTRHEALYRLAARITAPTVSFRTGIMSARTPEMHRTFLNMRGLEPLSTAALKIPFTLRRFSCLRVHTALGAFLTLLQLAISLRWHTIMQTSQRPRLSENLQNLQIDSSGTRRNLFMLTHARCPA